MYLFEIRYSHKIFLEYQNYVGQKFLKEEDNEIIFFKLYLLRNLVLKIRSFYPMVYINIEVLL